jgi:putative acyl-CoA dehydrogenase
MKVVPLRRLPVHNESIMTASTRQGSPLPSAHTSEKSDPIANLSKDQVAQNQVPPLSGYNLFLSDRTLVEAVEREGAGWAREQITELGRLLGTEEAQRWGFDANENKPVLHTHDRFGNRRDEVVFHPAWHSLMQTSVANRLHSLPWEKDPQGGEGTHRPGAHVARAALMMLTSRRRKNPACCWAWA